MAELRKRVSQKINHGLIMGLGRWRDGPIKVVVVARNGNQASRWIRLSGEFRRRKGNVGVVTTMKGQGRR